MIALSVAEENLIADTYPSPFYKSEVLRNEEMTPLFLATIEATEEAIINSLFAAETMTGRDGHRVEALPVQEVMEIMRK